MLPVITWLTYAGTGYVLYTLLFRVRYGFSPWVAPVWPRNAYHLADCFLACVLLGYSAWLVVPWLRAGMPAAVEWSAASWIGLGIWACGCLLRISAVWSLGPHWRIGQDETDTKHTFVATGIYRYTRHPINLGLIVVAIGQACMTGPDASALFLLIGAGAYAVVQNSNETRYWKRRQAMSKP